MSVGSHSGQSTKSIVEISKDIPGSVSATNERQCELSHVTHFNQFSDQSMVYNTDSDIFCKWSGQSDFQFCLQ